MNVTSADRTRAPWTLVALGITAGLLLAIVMAAPAGAQVGPPPTTLQSLTLLASEEVPPTTTEAEGTFLWRTTAAGIETEIIALGDDFTMAHFHLGAKGTNGPVVAFLFGPVEGQDAVHSTKTVTSADLIGPLAGKTLADLEKEIANGNIYVNLHSTTYPGGVLRAQLPKPAVAPAPPNTGTGTAATASFGEVELGMLVLALAAAGAALAFAVRRS
jgi:hypothetical protein